MYIYVYIIYIYIYIPLSLSLLDAGVGVKNTTSPPSFTQHGQVLRHLRLRRIASPEQPAPLPHVPEAGSFPLNRVEPMAEGLNFFRWDGDGASSYLMPKFFCSPFFCDFQEMDGYETFSFHTQPKGIFGK